MKITIDPFDRKSIAAAAKQLARYEKDFKTKEAEFVRRLKEIGVSVATAGFSTADYDGENDVIVTSTQNKGNALVIAYGKTVGFIEFGTGVRFPEWVDSNNASGKPYTPYAHGTYGEGRGANPKGWWYRSGQHTYGNPPAEAMLAARDAMAMRITEIAREVWGK